MTGQTGRSVCDAGLFECTLLRGKTVLVGALMLFSIGLVGSPVSWANSLTYQNVTFNMALNASGNLELNIVNALNATGNWTGVDYLKAFAINNFGDASGLSVSGATPVSGGLSNGGAGGCNGSGSGVCFNFGSSPGFTLTNDFTFTVVRTSGNFNLNLVGDEGVGPHLKVCFVGNKCEGDLLSKNIPAVPVPGTLLMFGVGFVMFALWYHRHLRKQVAFASAA